MTEFIYFLGRLHVLLLHLPIGILLLAVVLEALARRDRFNQLEPVVTLVWAAGALSAIGTAVLGYMHATESGFEGDAVDAHRIAGTALAILACAAWATRAKLQSVYAKAWPAFAAGVVLLLILTGHFGGNLTHGETYLVQYAPEPLQRLMGASSEHASRPAPADLASADIYLDLVAPALDQRCSNCHNDSKRKGELSVASYAALMKGGESGPVIVPGDVAASDLSRRIHLPHDHADFMPKDGKTPLTPQQTAAIDWWISIGAPQTGVMSALTAPPQDVRLALESVLGLQSVGGPALSNVEGSGHEGQVANNASEPMPDVPLPDPAAVIALENTGFVVRSIAKDHPLVNVDFTARRHITESDLEQLAKIQQQIQTLNLRNAGVTDAQLATIGQFTNLESLRLELNPVTDAGLAHLEGLKKLRYLNLYGTKVSDAGMAVLSRMENLRNLFVWKTAITDAGIAEFKRSHAEARINEGFDPRNFPVGPKVIPVVN